MPEQSPLAFIADCFIPALALVALWCLLSEALGGHRRLALMRLAALALGGIVAFGLRLLDEWLQLWPRAGLDYSTHTAVTLVLVLFLIAFVPKGFIIWLVMMGASGALMVRLDYHTLADLLTTAVPVTALFGPVLFALHRRYRFSPGPHRPPS